MSGEVTATPERIGLPFLAAWALLALSALAAIWLVRDLPMTDLPQHAAQVGTWIALADPDWPHRDLFEWNPATPYLAGYAAARAVAAWVPVHVAMKIVLSAAALAFPWAIAVWLARSGRDPFWGLLGFVVWWGFPFTFGFFNYLVALPIAFAYLASAFAHARRPSRRRALLVAGLGLALLAAHALALAVAGAIAAVEALARARSVGGALRRAAPLAVPLPLLAAWVVWIRIDAGEAVAAVPAAWSVGLDRFAVLPAVLAGYEGDLPSRIAGLAALALPLSLAIAGRAGRDPGAWRPFAVAFAIYALAPFSALGTPFLFRRTAVFLVPAAAFACGADRSRRAPRRAWVRAAIVGLALAWTAFVASRHVAFDREARGFHALMERLEPERKMLYLDVRPTSAVVPGVPYLHFASWYQAEKRGVVDFSFAMLYPEAVRYRPEARPAVGPGFEWPPPRFDARRHRDYDYYLVRSLADASGPIFRSRRREMRLVDEEGPWRVYAWREDR